jgi:hypothetical protein
MGRTTTADRGGKTMTFKRITFVLAAVAPLALNACTTASMSATVGGADAAAYSASGRTASDAQQSGPHGAPVEDGNTFVHRPEPGFDPDKIIEAP